MKPLLDRFHRLVKSARLLLKEKGFLGSGKEILKRISGSINQCHLVVVRHNLAQDHHLIRAGIDLTISEITLADESAIDQLTSVDEWKTSKANILKDLQEGQRCYVAKQQDRIIACKWAIVADKYEDSYLHRQFLLAPNEAYIWKSFTLREFRGKGAMPYLSTYLDDDLARRFGKTIGLGSVRSSNKSMLRALSKVGRIKVARLGFIQVQRIRFHYLWGRRAFSRTKKRFYLEYMH